MALKRFICLIGEDVTVYQTDDEDLARSYLPQEFTMIVDTKDGCFLDGDARIEELPKLDPETQQVDWP